MIVIMNIQVYTHMYPMYIIILTIINAPLKGTSNIDINAVQQK